MAETLTAVSEEVMDTQSGRYLTFMLSKEAYGIEIQYVMEIVGIQKVNPLPESPDYIKGVINLRGKIIPVIDMRIRLKKEAASYTDRTCIIVTNIKGITAGLIVDCVNEVLLMEEKDIVPPPDNNAGYQNKYIKGIGKSNQDICLLLDCVQLFKEDDPEISE